MQKVGFDVLCKGVAFEGKPSRWSSLTPEERLGYQIADSCGLLRAHPQWCERLEDWGLSIYLEPESQSDVRCNVGRMSQDERGLARLLVRAVPQAFPEGAAAALTSALDVWDQQLKKEPQTEVAASIQDHRPSASA